MFGPKNKIVLFLHDDIERVKGAGSLQEICDKEWKEKNGICRRSRAVAPAPYLSKGSPEMRQNVPMFSATLAY